MSDTPRTDAVQDELINQDTYTSWLEMSQTARQLERELNAANDRIKRLRDGIAKQNQTIEQACGKVLGYPWFKYFQKNFPGSTEKDGVCVGDHVAETIVCELVGKYMEALAHIKRLEEAGQRVDDAAHSIQDWSGTVLGDALDELNKAKEDKP